MPPRARQILSAVIVIFAGSAAAQTAKDFEASYENCATLAAKRFATGPDAADIIARASLDACQSQRIAYAQSLQRAGGATNVIISIVEQLDAVLVKQLKLLVLEERVRK